MLVAQHVLSGFADVSKSKMMTKVLQYLKGRPEVANGY